MIDRTGLTVFTNADAKISKNFKKIQTNSVSAEDRSHDQLTGALQLGFPRPLNFFNSTEFEQSKASEPPN